MAAVAMIGARPERVDRDALAAQLAGEAEGEHAHAELGDRVGDVRREPSLPHVERRRKHEDVRVRGTLQMRDGQLRAPRASRAY